VARSPQSASKSRRARANVQSLKSESASTMGRRALSKPGRSSTVRSGAARSASAKRQTSSRRGQTSRRMSAH
jgi:hypothetical protein